MSPKFRLAALFLLIAGAPIVTIAQQPAAQPDSPAAAAQAARRAAAARRKTGRVITNDDIAGIGSIYKGGAGPDLSNINDCDHACFDAVRTAARIYPNGFQWQKDLLAAIDQVRSDAPWQGLLSDFGTLRGRFCTLEQQRNEEIARAADPKNVTPAEISIEEKYDRLFRDAQADLLDLYDRARILKQAHANNLLEIGFMDYQTARIVNANCYFLRQRADHPNWESAGDP